VRGDEDPDPALALDGGLLHERLKLSEAVGVVLDPLAGLVEHEEDTGGLLGLLLPQREVIEDSLDEEPSRSSNTKVSKGKALSSVAVETVGKSVFEASILARRVMRRERVGQSQ